MAYTSQNQYLNKLLNLLPTRGSTVAIIYCVDDHLVAETIEHHIKIGFDAVLLVGDNLNFVYAHEKLIHYSAAIHDYNDIWSHLSNTCLKLTDHYIYWGYNAEFLFFPFCETRTVKDLVTFLGEERRQTLFGMVVDLYAMDFKKNGTGYDLEEAGFDAINYYSKPLDASFFSDINKYDGNRMPEIHGGLKWRYSEWFKNLSTTINRVPFFLATDKLEFDKNGLTDNPEFYSYHCEHHRNPTGAIMSFRTAIDLRHNPASRQSIHNFSWVGTETFTWNSPQLLRLGFIETGQWF